MDSTLKRTRRRAGVLELALLAPLLVLIGAEAISYGGYVWISHSVQSLADESVHAAVSGASTGERNRLAQQAMAAKVGGHVGLDPVRAGVGVLEESRQVTVTVTYDASGSPFWALQGLAPMPSSTIIRQATIQSGR